MKEEYIYIKYFIKKNKREGEKREEVYVILFFCWVDNCTQPISHFPFEKTEEYCF